MHIDINLWETEGDIYIHRLSKAAHNYTILQTQISESEKLQSKMNDAENRMKDIQQSVATLYPHWHTASAQAHEIKNLTAEWTSFSMEATALHGKQVALNERVLQVEKLLQAYLEGNNSVSIVRLHELTSLSTDSIHNLRNKHQALYGHKTAQQAVITQAEEALVPIIQRLEESDIQPESIDFNLLAQETALQLETLKEELQSGHEQLGKFRQMLEEDEKKRQAQEKLIAQMEAARKAYSRWDVLHQLFGSSDGKKFRNIAQSYVLRHLLVGANHYLNQLTDRYELECNPGSLTILICDKEAGGVTRPTTTMSGGESFLISLALALGLSSLNRKALAMDTLFIDEGFGTLDSTYLATVMDTLERLHQIGGKKIGIISHVESLKERISTHIQLVRENNTTSRVKVVSII